MKIKQQIQELFPTPLWILDIAPADAAPFNASLKAEIDFNKVTGLQPESGFIPLALLPAPKKLEHAPDRLNKNSGRQPAEATPGITVHRIRG